MKKEVILLMFLVAGFVGCEARKTDVITEEPTIDPSFDTVTWTNISPEYSEGNIWMDTEAMDLYLA